jgi:DNA-binding response OmpR family regulator
MSGAAPPSKARTSKILVVEDDPAISALLKKALENNAYRVVTAGDGEEALIVCVEERPDVILLDVNLPKLDGFSVAKRLKGVDSLKNIPIIFLTAKDRPTDMIQGIQSGAKHYLTKPFNMDDLLSKVKKLLRG